MADPLAGIGAKLQRGDHHLERIDLEVAAFLYSHPWQVSFERDHERGRDWYLATFSIERQPPREWSIRVGEAVHQYRSSLDHLMTELARLRSTTHSRRPDRSPNFPICKPGVFWQPRAMGKRSLAESLSKGLRPEHFTEVERLQPKQPEDMSGRGDLNAFGALARLRWVDDLDKHATVQPGFIAPRRVVYHSFWNIGNTGDVDPKRTNADFEELWKPFTPLDHGTKLYRARFRFGPQMSVPLTIEPDVTFGMDPYPWLTLDSIRASFEWVRRIIARFEEITPEFGGRTP